MRKYLVFLGLALVIFTGLVLFATKDRTDQQKQVDQVEKQGEAQVGGPFTLVDQNGKTVSDGDFRGRLMLVFFGFTHCPDECPLTTAAMSKTMLMLKENASQVAPIFITVDPQRDKPEALKDFLSNFDKRMIGLTGAPEQIKQVEGLYKVYAAKQETAAGQPAPEPGEDYGVDHSTVIYLMGRDGKFLSMFPYNATSEEMAHSIEHYLNP